MIDSYTSGQNATRVRYLGRGEIVIAVVLVVLPVTLGLGMWAAGRQGHPIALFAATSAMVGLATMRVASAWRNSHAVAVDLASAERFATALSRHASDAVAVVDEHGVINRRGSAPGRHRLRLDMAYH